MIWKELSNEAKNIIEWVEDPHTGEKLTIEIRIGECFNPCSGVNIMVTPELYQEVIKFVTEDDELQGVQTEEKFVFRSKKISDNKVGHGRKPAEPVLRKHPTGAD